MLRPMTDSAATPPPDWDERYAAEGWAFGSEPNDFLREHAHLLPVAGRVLCLA
ncbi:MAG: SAM-dependent methyltransferase, partial [Candidatus Eisenbacteria bacterium]|nr:SAM-dependent methyltransferase [Candidatus Eisenbacteria bacterium]